MREGEIARCCPWLLQSIDVYVYELQALITRLTIKMAAISGSSSASEINLEGDKTDCTSPSPADTEYTEDRNSCSSGAGPSSEDQNTQSVLGVEDVSTKCIGVDSVLVNNETEAEEIVDEDWDGSEMVASDEDNVLNDVEGNGLVENLSSSWSSSQHPRSWVRESSFIFHLLCFISLF